MKQIKERCFVEKFMINVMVPFNYYQKLFMTPLGPFKVDGGVLWSCGDFYFLEFMMSLCTVYVGSI